MAEQITLSQKIKELFAYRRIPELLRMAGIQQDSPFVAHLETLQAEIYGLDLLLETQWKLKNAHLRPAWKAIHDALGNFGIRKKELNDYTEAIRQYEEDELALRDGILPLSRPMRKTYTSKSCDVKLIRRLIYRHAPDLKHKIRERDWIYYDLITEVNDDIDDVFEDCETWNGNRFLISVLCMGKRKANRTYKDFLAKSGKDARAWFKKRKGDEVAMLADWTRVRLEETRTLLRDTIEGKKLYLVKHSAIASKMKH